VQVAMRRQGRGHHVASVALGTVDVRPDRVAAERVSHDGENALLVVPFDHAKVLNSVRNETWAPAHDESTIRSPLTAHHDRWTLWT